MLRVPNPKPLTLPFSVSLEMREFPGWHAVDRNTASNFIGLTQLPDDFRIFKRPALCEADLSSSDESSEG